MFSTFFAWRDSESHLVTVLNSSIHDNLPITLSLNIIMRVNIAFIYLFISGNFGLFERHQLTKGSKQFDMVGIPLNDCLHLDRYMLNGVHLRIMMLRNQPEFCLMSDDGGDENQTGYQIRIEDAFLRLTKLKVNPAILVSHSKVLKDVSAKFPYVKTDLKVANIIAGQNSFAWDMINSSYLPRTAIVAFVDSSALVGAYDKNPFNFQHFDLKRLSILVNGVSTPGAPIQVNFDVNETSGACVLEVFDRLYDANRRKNEIGAIGGSGHMGLELARKDIKNGYAIYLFDLEPVLNEGVSFDLLKTGSLSLHATFGTALTTNVSCLLYFETYGMIDIDESRVVRLFECILIT